MKITANQSKKTFTLKVNGNKFRTVVMSKNEFQELECNTANDWINFLRTQSGSYYQVN